ncbi:shikimate dehydrogenase [Gordonia sp. HY002]|uniref:shikimate dehydrogenase n=1 Tax=Gordonia zhenghanii TaxID=2911516 RepID=UPI001EF0A5F9|nr:shikimate dehydrogenase [Gordonia zhenghanii]MCF8569746.1 shikimate dehydrogenase [Gordonia zhenghanii]MCF8603220.1 shikimate dehydrogenase [Gordonia zhenghanii]
MNSAPPARRAAVLGSPVGHSRSPALHRAAYAALGLDGWSYDAIDTTADGLAQTVGEAGPEWIGYSVTMPCKSAALAFADAVTDRAELIGSANTLVRSADGWLADCTDVDGVTGALAQTGIAQPPTRAVLIGAGGTARPALAALAEAGVSDVVVVARDAGRASGVLELAERLSVHAQVLDFAPSSDLRNACTSADVTVSTVPASAAEILASSVAATSRLVDVIYDPWPTPLAAAVADAGGTVVGGLVMLLHQAYNQVERFTGKPAPKAAMAAAVGIDLP